MHLPCCFFYVCVCSDFVCTPDKRRRIAIRLTRKVNGIKAMRILVLLVYTYLYSLFFIFTLIHFHLFVKESSLSLSLSLYYDLHLVVFRRFGLV